MIPTLTVFTCTYNRAHTIERTYQSLCRQTCKDFCWLVIDDGSTDNTEELVHIWLSCENGFEISYVKKSNGGLHTGYNKAIEMMNTEICVCIDSDDWMPDDAVENIISFWKEQGSEEYAGIIGLDYFPDGKPIGGFFPENLKSSHLASLDTWHRGDVKMVHRTELLKKVAPMPSFKGEKFFNPIYLFLKVDQILPMLIVNKNFCYVDYQDANNSMSKNIMYQYVQSPNSFKEYRLLNMKNPRLSYIKRIRHAVHYVASCIMTKDVRWMYNSPMKFSTIMVSPLGVLLYLYINQNTINKATNYQ